MDKNIKTVLNRKDLAKMVANKLGVTIEDIDTILSTFVDCIEESLLDDKIIAIVKLGKFIPYRTEIKKPTGCFTGKGLSGGHPAYKFSRSDYLLRRLRDKEKIKIDKE